ncbi:MAG: kelch repeat-containing protein [Bacteroidota bacterium]
MRSYTSNLIVISKIFSLVFLLFFTERGLAQTWTAKSDFINGESDYAYAFTINDSIYVGNTQGLGFYKYDPINNLWSTKANVPAALNNRWAGIGFAVNGKGYMIGGVNASGICTNDVWEYDPITDTWIQKTDFPGGKRMSAGYFVIGSKVYIGGGVDTTNLIGLSVTTPKNDFWQYDPATDAWTSKGHIPYDSSYLEAPFAFSIGSKGYLSCGRHFSLYNGSYGYVYEDSTFQYDTLMNTWTPVALFTGARRFAGVSFVLNNIAYCGTGLSQSSSYDCFSDFFSFDPIANSWTALPTTTFASRGFGMATTISTGKAFFGTGWCYPSGTAFYKDWWEFSPTSTGITNEPVNNVGITCFPIPCNDELNVEINTHDIRGYTYSIYNLLGQLKIENELSDNKKIRTTTLAEGNYILMLRGAGSEYHQIFRVVK